MAGESGTCMKPACARHPPVAMACSVAYSVGLHSYVPAVFDR